MSDIFERAGVWGFDTEYRDAFGNIQRVSANGLARLLESFPTAPPEPQALPRSVVLRQGGEMSLQLVSDQDLPIRWTLLAGRNVIAQGSGTGPSVSLPRELPRGMFRLEAVCEAPAGDRHEQASLIVSPPQAYQGRPKAPRRMWALAFQLYAVRSENNWGHGDFGDLLSMIDLAAELGSAGIALNPLHALFEDAPEQASPYSPSSRLFLNPLYIALDQVPEFRHSTSTGFDSRIETLRAAHLVDYHGVAAAKREALRIAYDNFRSDTLERQIEFHRFRQDRGAVLLAYAAYEVLRRNYRQPWWDWPEPWRTPTPAALRQLRAEEPDVEYHEFVQWLAHEQLNRCRAHAAAKSLSIGLYLDVAVGVRSDGFDTWYDQTGYLRRMSIGAPPDILNIQGQNWGLASFDPVALEASGFAPYRRMLEASMRYAGAIRIDHVLGLNRLYMIPEGASADQGAYLRFPFDAMLAVTALSSVEHRCIVIGEDLGTVPENFRETLADWGLWSYQLMLFERQPDGAFAPPESYRENALVSFNTHDLPTFAGWKDQHDIAVKESLGLNPGETRTERTAAYEALRRALNGRGLGEPTFGAAVRYMSATPCRLLVAAIEDVLGVVDQINLPGTTDQHPNWRRRLPLTLEAMRKRRELGEIARACARSDRV